MAHGLEERRKIQQPDLRWVATMDPAIDSKLLERLAQDAPESLLERIAEHPNASKSLLKQLSAHSAAGVRSAVTENPNAPEAFILSLASDPHPDVRFRIAENARSSLNALKLLVDDENPYVADRAARTLARIEGKPSRLTMHVTEYTVKTESERTTGEISGLIAGIKTPIGAGLFMPVRDRPENKRHENEVRPVVPFTPMVNKRAASQKKVSPQAEKLRILVIEDNPADARLLEKSLSQWPFELSCVDCLSAGLAHLAHQPPDVVLLDLSLPDAQGIETFYLVHCQVPHIPVVVLTGLEDESTGNEAVQLGAQDYLVKGQVTPGLLARAIRYAVERHESEVRIKELNESLERRVLQLAAANQDLERLTEAMVNSSTQARDLLDRLARVMYKESPEQPKPDPAIEVRFKETPPHTVSEAKVRKIKL